MQSISVTDHLGQEFESISAMCRHWNINMKTYAHRLNNGLTQEEALTRSITNASANVSTDHLGNTFESLVAMCEYWNVSKSAFYHRTARGWTLEETLTGIRNGKKVNGSSKTVTDHLGNTFKSITDMCKHYNISSSAYRHRLAKGYTVEQALTQETSHNIVHESVTDHLGQQFDSKREMAIHWNTSVETIDRRLRNGWTLEQALTGYGPKSVTDHLGERFATQADMCKKWNVNSKLFSIHIAQGWTLEQALTGYGPDAITDHLGNKFKSIQEMCKHYNISYAMYQGRIALGWSIEDAITIDNQSNNEPIYDHLGNKFNSITAMCKHWNVSRNAYSDRVNRGWSIEDALTKPLNNPTIDHTGKKFETVSDMCRYWNIKPSQYYNRIKAGWTLKQALTSQSPNDTECTDHLGQVFATQKEMCKFWNISVSTYKFRLNNHTQEEALTMFTEPFKISDSLYILNLIEPGYCLCLCNNHEIVMTNDMIYETLKINKKGCDV